MTRLQQGSKEHELQFPEPEQLQEPTHAELLP